MKRQTKIIFILLFVLANYTIGQTTFERLYNYSQRQSGYQVSEVDIDRYLFLTENDCFSCRNSVQLLIVNQIGDTILTKGIDFGNETYANKFIQTGNSFIIPITNLPVSNNSFVTVLKTDSILNEIWHTDFTLPGWNFQASGLTQTSDSGFIVCGYANPANGSVSDLLILKLNSTGNILWHKIVDFYTPADLTSVIESDNGTLIFAGGLMVSPGRSKTLIYKTDSLGDSLMTKTFSFNSYSHANFISKWRNQYIVGGYASDTTILNSDGPVLFLDSNLDSTSSYTFDLGLHESIYSFISDSSEFLVCGRAINSSQTIGDVFILRFDTNNTFVSYKVINGPGAEYYSANISKTTDGGLIIGTTSYNSFGYPSALLIKTDINGDLLVTPEIGINLLEIISPNPSTGKFYFKGKNKVETSTVYSILGKKMREFSGNEIDLTGYKEGIYFYEAMFNSGLIQKGKLIKVN